MLLYHTAIVQLQFHSYTVFRFSTVSKCEKIQKLTEIITETNYLVCQEGKKEK